MTQAELVEKVAAMWLKTEVLSNCHQAAEELIAVARPIIEANVLQHQFESMPPEMYGPPMYYLRQYARKRGLEIKE